MKIDYELVEKIGANCYMICDDGSIGYFIIDGNNVYVHSNETGDTNLIPLSIHEIVKFGVKPIPPKLPVRVEYEKVTESIFDLRDEFERGELYCKNLAGNDDFQLLRTVTALSGCYSASNIYRRIEKPFDEKEEFIKHCMEVSKEDDTENDRIWMSNLYDSGCRLVTK